MAAAWGYAVYAPFGMRHTKGYLAANHHVMRWMRNRDAGEGQRHSRATR